MVEKGQYDLEKRIYDEYRIVQISKWGRPSHTV
jgi:hypothetical protein